MIRKDYMGIIVVNHCVLDKPALCYGTQSPVNAITELSVHEAGYDSKGKIIKGDQLVKIRMSDLQFGKLIIKTNSSLHPCTLESLQGFRVDYTQLERDPTLTKVAKEIERSSSSDIQVQGFISELRDIVDESNLKKRLVNKGRVLGLLELIARNSTSNFKYGLREVASTATSRVIEIKSQIHNMIRNSYRNNNKRLPQDVSEGNSDKTTLSSLASAGVFNLSGRYKLFDSISTDDAVMLNIGVESSHFIDSEIEKVNDVNNTMKSDIFISNEVADVKMSLEQFARFVRADSTEVPCTIARIGHFVSKDTVVTDKRELSLGNLDELAKTSLGDTLALVKEAIELLNQTGCKKAADRHRLTELVGNIETVYAQSEGRNTQAANKVTNNVLSQLQDEVNEFLEEEILQLPENEANKIKQIFSKLSK
jgi:hypothetical protein